MKYLGIDFGTKRVGVAISDDGGEFAFPKMILDAKDAQREIEKICKEDTVEGIVVGQSIAANEQDNELQAAASRFAERLAAATGAMIHFEREDFSSVEAHRYQTGAGARDDSAAAVILQRFLDKKRTVR